MPTPNPSTKNSATSLPDVRESARFVTDQAKFVHVDLQAITRWSQEQTADSFNTPAPPDELQYTGPRDASANLILLLDCLNFCFWSELSSTDLPAEPPAEDWKVEYRNCTWQRTYAMYAAVLRAIEDDAAWLTPARWADVDSRDVANLFKGQGSIPQPQERQQVLNETGAILIEHFQGQFQNAVEQANHQAKALAYLLAERFPSFCDAPKYQGQTVAILKRAQICAADLHHCFVRQGYDQLKNLDELTVFADYRLPQYLRHVGIIKIEEGFARRIEAQEEIAASSEEEIELRCATIAASEQILKSLQEQGLSTPAWQLDFVLWERSHDQAITIPHHRTQSIYY